MTKVSVNKSADGNLYEIIFTYSETKSRSFKLSETSYKALEAHFKPKVKKAKKQPNPPPTLQEVKDFFKLKGYQEESAVRFFNGYENGNPPWHDSRGNPVVAWKQKAIMVWFKPENLIKQTKEESPKKSFFDV